MKPEHMKTGKLVNATPETMHRVVGHGLNLEGECRNQNCRVFEKNVWVQLGYGKFHINQEVYNTSCPICKVELPSETVLSLGYTRAIIKAEGKVEGEKKK
jgi:hypothetical protein